MKEKFEEFHENGNLKRSGYKNEWGKIDGYVILYDENGIEKEKLKYENGMRLGNVLSVLSDEELKEILVNETYLIPVEDMGEDDLSEDAEEMQLQELSALLKGEKYY